MITFNIVGGVCNFLGFVLSQQKFEATDGQCYSSWMGQCYSSMLQLSLVYKVKENTSLGCEGMPTQNRWREESPWPNFGSSFYMFFLLLLGLPHVNWVSQECSLFTWGPHSSPQTFLCSIFVGFSLLCLLATAILDSFFLLYLPNNIVSTLFPTFFSHLRLRKLSTSINCMCALDIDEDLRATESENDTVEGIEESTQHFSITYKQMKH